jgi:hypothetical protein
MVTSRCAASSLAEEKLARTQALNPGQVQKQIHHKRARKYITIQQTQKQGQS